MTTLICLLFFTAFLVWMCTSKKVNWKNKGKLFDQLAHKPQRAKYIATLILCVAFSLCVLKLGLGAGIFAGIVILMAMGSLVVLFFPFQYLNVKWLGLLFFVCFLIELSF